ncbi:MAG: D-aminoacyl-tRNA deacylase [Desulfovibrio sp.]
MRLVLQRVSEAKVTVEGKVTGEIEEGFLILAGFGGEDSAELPTEKVWDVILNKILDLRVFSDDQGKMNLSLRDIKGGLLIVSQFTLYATCKKGRRPSFSKAAPPQLAEALYDTFVEEMKKRAPAKVETGIFGADMDVSLNNQGPVTIILEDKDFR